MNVLGVKMTSHDTGAALISGERIIAIAEERLNRVKYSENIFPDKSIQYCLDAIGVQPSDIDLIVTDWIGDKEIEAGTLAERYFHEHTDSRFTKAKFVTVNHHDAHAATAFFCSPFEDAAILVYDGNGDTYINNQGVRVVETETMYRGTGTTITQISKTSHARVGRRFPYTWGIGKLYSNLSRDYIGFGPHNEGKMMGLAAYGDNQILKEFPVDRWITNEKGQLVCNSEIDWSRGKKLLAKRTSWTGLPRMAYFALKSQLIRSRATRSAANPHIFKPIRFNRGARDPKTVSLPDKYFSSVAYAAQKLFEQFAIQLGNQLRDITQSDNLCVAGGCALNIDANRNFLTEVGFKDIFVQPASSDCGIALGCALWGTHVSLKQPRFWVMKSASLGRSYSLQEVDDAIAEFDDKIVSRISSNIADEAAQIIADGNIIGWFQGGSEYGPRALGNRSILANAGNKDMRDILNKRVKHREMWRPFATSMLAERLEDWFELRPSSTTAFMLLCAEVREDKRALVPSIVHVDNTCRMQTLTKDNNGIYYDLVKSFEKLTGTPLVINTSFNLGGEPIVESPFDAIHTFMRTDMDYLVLENRIIQKVK